MSPNETGDTDYKDERQIILNLPFDRAFDACMLALQQFTFREIEEFDQGRGVIVARVSTTETSAPKWSFATGWLESRITFTLIKQGSGKTEVTITSRIVAITGYRNRIYMNLYGPWRNFENLKILTAFLMSRESLKEERSVLEYTLTEPGIPKEQWNLVDPSETAFMSLILPGMGQSYTGRYVRGLLFAALVAAGLIFYIVPGVLLWIAAGYDAYRVARQVNCGSLPFVPVNFGLLMAQVIVGGMMIFCTLLFGFVGYFPFHG